MWVDQQLNGAPTLQRLAPGALAPDITTPGEAPMHHQVIDVATAATHEIVFGAAGAKIGLRELVLWNAQVTQTLTLQTAAGRRIVRLTDLAGGVGWDRRDNGRPFFVIDAGQSLMLQTTAAGVVDGYVRYILLDQLT